MKKRIKKKKKVKTPNIKKNENKGKKKDKENEENKKNTNKNTKQNKEESNTSLKKSKSKSGKKNVQNIDKTDNSNIQKGKKKLDNSTKRTIKNEDQKKYKTNDRKKKRNSILTRGQIEEIEKQIDNIKNELESKIKGPIKKIFKKFKSKTDQMRIDDISEIKVVDETFNSEISTTSILTVDEITNPKTSKIEKELKPKDSPKINMKWIKPLSDHQNKKFSYQIIKENENEKINQDEFILNINAKIRDDLDILKEKKKELFKEKAFFDKKGYVLTDKSSERMAMLIHYIQSGIPVLLEGPTGTSKTRTTLIACDYITEKINKNEKKDELLRFNLSAETKIDDLIVKYSGDNNSASGLKVEEGVFFRAYTKGHKILLDEINLAPREVLECIQQSLDSKVLSVESSGKVLQKYDMHEDFGIIATQNPNKGAFANKRQELGIGFLSRFQKINFPNFSEK